MTIREAAQAVIEEGWRGMVRREDKGGPIKRRIYVAQKKTWQDRGDPECMVPATFDIEDLTSPWWEPSDEP